MPRSTLSSLEGPRSRSPLVRVTQQSRVTARLAPSQVCPQWRSQEALGLPKPFPVTACLSLALPLKTWFSHAPGEKHLAVLETANHGPNTTAILGGHSQNLQYHMSGGTGHLYIVETSRCLSCKLQTVCKRPCSLECGWWIREGSIPSEVGLMTGHQLSSGWNSSGSILLTLAGQHM